MATPARAAPPPPAPVIYPESDGEPMADNTEQFDFISMVQGNLDALLPDFVAGDHLWYPVEGRPDIRVAPDVYVALSRPKGPRGSYLQWKEAGVPLTVVFEWWSPDSTFAKELAKLRFYDRHGVSEFYTWDQVRQQFAAFVREGNELVPVNVDGGFVSPRLGIRFAVTDDALRIFRPDGKPFRSYRELTAERDAAAAERDALKAKLRAMGIDPDAP